ncbi:pyruvate decarboxylase [Elizabethkingia sp. JS20170427COW]|uniref:pyruvate decarboxylase n=1 Tax=Elizabethkingia sp. JS20170427COW TaxID=2583851 RepID=UPI001110834C|nr:pyruvate decarboxylase [Elizabethkingia sp. JS20170427COW]QCX53846.1 pyruvate decarboxylase [Elizabethkingia sp. JS20170427COW]
MAVFLQPRRDMKKVLLYGTLAAVAAGVLISCAGAGNSKTYINKDLKLGKIQRIVYLNPEIYPKFEALQEPTDMAFYSATSDRFRKMGDIQLARIDSPMEYDKIDIPTLKELCENNLGDLIVVPHVKYFKVGLGKYVFSNQVLVRLKVYNKEGKFVMETNYDTYKAGGKLKGSAENYVETGASEVFQKMFKELKKQKIIDNVIL